MLATVNMHIRLLLILVIFSIFCPLFLNQTSVININDSELSKLRYNSLKMSISQIISFIYMQIVTL